jgi:hypothetical protein
VSSLKIFLELKIISRAKILNLKKKRERDLKKKIIKIKVIALISCIKSFKKIQLVPLIR